jgi:hypothetical protein
VVALNASDDAEYVMQNVWLQALYTAKREYMTKHARTLDCPSMQGAKKRYEKDNRLCLSLSCIFIVTVVKNLSKLRHALTDPRLKEIT